MPATPWTEKSVTGGRFQEGVSQNDGSDDFFIDVLFEGTGFFAVMPWSGTERSISTTAHAERSITSTPWTERSG